MKKILYFSFTISVFMFFVLWVLGNERGGRKEMRMKGEMVISTRICLIWNVFFILSPSVCLCNHENGKYNYFEENFNSKNRKILNGNGILSFLFHLYCIYRKRLPNYQAVVVVVNSIIIIISIKMWWKWVPVPDTDALLFCGYVGFL